MPRYTALVYPDEALAMARDAIRLHLAGLVEDGEEVPEEDEPPLVAAKV